METYGTLPRIPTLHHRHHIYANTYTEHHINHSPIFHIYSEAPRSMNTSLNTSKAHTSDN